MKNSSLILTLIFLQITTYSQTIIYQQDFNDPVRALNGFLLVNVDQGQPTAANYATLADSAWVIKELDQTGNYVAFGTSDYDEEIPADDWMITPAIRLGKSSKLSWKGMSFSSGAPDSYEVFISTSGQSINGCLLNFPVMTVTDETYDVQEHMVDLAGLGFAEQTVFIGFHLNTVSGGDALGIDDIVVTDDSVSAVVALTFTVNMSRYIAEGKFNSSTDTVDIVGNFNGWDGSNYILSLLPDTDSSIYSITIPGFLVGDVLEFKFRINSSWNDTSVEFPYGGPNRIWEIEQDLYFFQAYYNEVGSVFSLNPGSDLLADILIYPNPVKDHITIEYPHKIRKILMVSQDGRMIDQWDVIGNVLKKSIEASPGLYFLMFFDSGNFLGSRKVIIR